jgi:hypothetical protein
MEDLIKIVREAIKNPRSKEEIKATFMNAGIIDENGDLKEPYKSTFA